MIKNRKCKNTKMIKMCKLENMKMQKCDQILHKEMRGSISALKPGPVVPPGTQKTPDQAARISQSVDFGHLSDILAILGGVSFFDLFSHFFTFSFLSFYHFSVFLFFTLFHFFWFSHFYCFSVLMIFDQFLLFFVLMINFCHFLSSN